MSSGANADAAPDNVRGASAEPSSAQRVAVRPRVLCVDDEPQVLKMLARTLGPHFEVVTLDDPLAALEAVREGRFSVVISDMLMPRMDGATFLERVKQLAPDTTRLALTGCLESRVSPDVAFGIVTKPFRVTLLHETVSAAAHCHALLVAARGADAERGSSVPSGGAPVHGSAVAVSNAMGPVPAVQSSESGLRLRPEVRERRSSIPSGRSAARSIPAARLQPLALKLLGAVVELWPRATVLGRTMDCDIVVNDPRIAPRHVRFFSSWRGTTVQDVSGTGGVRLNGERLRGVLFIQPGDTISLGAFDIAVGFADAAADKR
jgi:CheY-like chemotaxis protein